MAATLFFACAAESKCSGSLYYKKFVKEHKIMPNATDGNEYSKKIPRTTSQRPQENTLPTQGNEIQNCSRVTFMSGNRAIWIPYSEIASGRLLKLKKGRKGTNVP